MTVSLTASLCSRRASGIAVGRPHLRLNVRNISTSTLKIDQSRLLNDIHWTCQWGKGQRYGDHDTQTGMSRLALTDADKLARNWFKETASSLGCSVTTDQMGNQFAIRPGKKDGAPTYAGSHLDTQPTGGRYDGILGVTAAIEMLRVLDDNRIKTNYPVGVVNWTNEEGARFPMSMMSSGVWSGDIPLEKAHSMASVVRSEQNVTVKSELQRIGYLGTVPASYESTPMAAHFELHIEQGPILEKERQKIGIVEGVQAYRWFTISVQGRDSHTGTTDLRNRGDALLAASKMIVAAREVAWQEGGLASIGIIEASPGSTNTVPGSVRFSLDVRGKENQVIKNIEKRLRETFAFIASGKTSVTLADKNEPPSDKVNVEWKTDFDSKATKFSEKCIGCVTEAAKDIFGDDFEKLTRSMTSGAGHDSVYTSKRVPTSMIFVPSKDGISHNPVEFTSDEDCALGAQVLMGAVLKFDQQRTQ